MTPLSLPAISSFDETVYTFIMVLKFAAPTSNEESTIICKSSLVEVSQAVCTGTENVRKWVSATSLLVTCYIILTMSIDPFLRW